MSSQRNRLNNTPSPSHSETNSNLSSSLIPHATDALANSDLIQRHSIRKSSNASTTPERKIIKDSLRRNTLLVLKDKCTEVDERQRRMQAKEESTDFFLNKYIMSPLFSFPQRHPNITLLLLVILSSLLAVATMIFVRTVIMTSQAVFFPSNNISPINASNSTSSSALHHILHFTHLFKQNLYDSFSIIRTLFREASTKFTSNVTRILSTRPRFLSRFINFSKNSTEEKNRINKNTKNKQISESDAELPKKEYTNNSTENVTEDEENEKEEQKHQQNYTNTQENWTQIENTEENNSSQHTEDTVTQQILNTAQIEEAMLQQIKQLQSEVQQMKEELQRKDEELKEHKEEHV